MAGTILGKPWPLILLGSTETHPKYIFFSNSNFKVVIDDLECFLPPCGGFECFLNTELIHFHKGSLVCLPFLLMFVHFRGCQSDLREGSVQKTQSPEASRFSYILRRIIIRSCKGYIPVLIPALNMSILPL